MNAMQHQQLEVPGTAKKYTVSLFMAPHFHLLAKYGPSLHDRKTT